MGLRRVRKLRRVRASAGRRSPGKVAWRTMRRDGERGRRNGKAGRRCGSGRTGQGGLAAGLPKVFIYPFFLFHMLMFGISGFVLAYGADGDVAFLYMHGGIAIVVYLVFYFAIFGREQVKWMFIKAGLGTMGIYSQIGWILGLFGRNANDTPASVTLFPHASATVRESRGR